MRDFPDVRIGLSPVAILAALLALVSQISLGALVLPDDAAVHDSAWRAASVLCTGAHGATVGATPAQAPRHHHRAPEGAVCPLAAALAAPAFVLAPMVAMPPRDVAVLRRALPPTRAPPPPLLRETHGWSPRGPPGNS